MKNQIKYIALLFGIGLTFGFVANATIFDSINSWFNNELPPAVQDQQVQNLGAPSSGTYQTSLFPLSNQTYLLGSSTRQWLSSSVKNASSTVSSATTLCLTGDTCITSWSAGSGTVTSVDMSVPTGLTIGGNPIVDSGTLALTYTAGYSIPLTASSTQWNTAYNWGDHALAGYLTSIPWGTYDPYGQATSTLGTHTTTYNHANYDTAYGWGNHASAGYLTLVSTTTPLTGSGTVLSPLAINASATGTPGYVTNNLFDYWSAKQAPGSYLTSNQNITITGAVTGSGTTAINTQLATTTFDYWWNNTTGITPSNQITDGTGLTWSTSTLNCDTASSSVQGCLTSADWTTFNDKQATVSAYTPLSIAGNQITIATSSTSVSGFLTSTDWNTFNNKQATITDGTNLTFAGATLNVDDPFSVTKLIATNASSTALSISSTGYFNLNATGTMQGYAFCTSGNGLCASGGASLTGTQGQLTYFSGTNTAVGTSTLFISTAGNVGIGTTTPNNPLTVQGNAYINGSLTVGTSSLQLMSGNIISNSGQFNITNSANTALTFSTNNSERLRIDNSGNVGIGLSAPTSTLAVLGNFHAMKTGGADGLFFNSSTGNVGVGTTTPGALLDVNLTAGATGAVGLRVSTGYSMNDIFRWYDGTTQMGVIKNTGNVGIGTTTPTLAQLVVNNGVWAGGDISALTFTDRTPYPKDLQEAYDAVLSMEGKNGEVDHSKLDPFIKSTDGNEGRNLSALVSAQNEVIKDILKRIDKPLGSFDSNGDFQAIEEMKQQLKQEIKTELIEEIKRMNFTDKIKLLW